MTTQEASTYDWRAQDLMNRIRYYLEKGEVAHLVKDLKQADDGSGLKLGHVTVTMADGEEHEFFNSYYAFEMIKALQGSKLEAYAAKHWVRQWEDDDTEKPDEDELALYDFQTEQNDFGEWQRNNNIPRP